MTPESPTGTARPSLCAAPGSAFDFTPRPPGQSYVAKGGLKEWPDEWVCENCAWVKPCETPRKRVYCRKWKRGMNARSDRACYEEPLEILRAREAQKRQTQNTQAHSRRPDND